MGKEKKPTLKVNIILMCEVQYIISLIGLNRFQRLAFRVLEVDRDSEDIHQYVNIIILLGLWTPKVERRGREYIPCTGCWTHNCFMQACYIHRERKEASGMKADCEIE